MLVWTSFRWVVVDVATFTDTGHRDLAALRSVTKARHWNLVLELHVWSLELVTGNDCRSLALELVTDTDRWSLLLELVIETDTDNRMASRYSL